MAPSPKPPRGGLTRSTEGVAMSTKSLLYVAAVSLAVAVAYDKYGKRG